MKVIFDEGLPDGLGDYLAGHQISSVRRQGWSGTTNGKLLDLIEGARFEAFISNDKRLEREHDLSRRSFAALLLSTNNWPTMEPNVGVTARALFAAKPGRVIKVDCGIFIPKRFRKR